MKRTQPPFKAAIIVLCIIGWHTTSFTQAGTLDSSFNLNGKVITDISGDDDLAQSIAIQSDGKILLAGFSKVGFYYDLSMVRYNSDGSLDISFNLNGTVINSIANNDDRVHGIAIQSDGKILLVGDFYSISRQTFVIRYMPNGSIDSTFGTNGITYTPSGTDYFATDIDIQLDGKILVAGYSDSASNFDFSLIRYDINGILDNSFDHDGIVKTPIGMQDDAASDMFIQTDGKILLGGSSYNGSHFDFAAARYTIDGSLDSTFGFNGIVLTAITSSDDKANTILVDNDGNILLGGLAHQSFGNNSRDFALVRYDSDGQLDPSFDFDGIVTTDYNTNDDGVLSLSLQSDGKIIAGGFTDPFFGGVNDTSYYAATRYNSNGSLDSSFGLLGKVTTNVRRKANIACCSAIQPDGKLVLGGWSYHGSDLDFSAARYHLGTSLSSENDDLDFPNKLSIFPNPSSGELNIDYTGITPHENFSINIYNTYGIKLVEQNLAPSHEKIQLHLSTLLPGTYFLSLQSQDRSITQKFILY